MKPICKIEKVATITCPVCGWKAIHDFETDELKNCPECNNNFRSNK